MLKIQRKQPREKKALAPSLETSFPAASESLVTTAPLAAPTKAAAGSPELPELLTKLRKLAEQMEASAPTRGHEEKLKSDYLGLLEEMTRQTQAPAHKVAVTPQVAEPETRPGTLTLFVFNEGAPTQQRDIAITHHLKQTVRNLRVQAQNVLSADVQSIPADFSQDAAALTARWLQHPAGSTLTPDDGQAAKRVALSLLR